MIKWKDIPGYEGIYQASTDGQIRTCQGKVTSNARYNARSWKQRELKQKLHADKHGRTDARVDLWKDGKHATYLVSRLIAMTWVEGYADNMTVNHIDGNPLNNSAENLEWVSLAQNIRHGFETGLYSKNQTPTVVVNGSEIHVFPSMAEASRYIGKSSRFISNALHRRKKVC